MVVDRESVCMEKGILLFVDDRHYNETLVVDSREQSLHNFDINMLGCCYAS
jgi:hypothetical protein